MATKIQLEQRISELEDEIVNLKQRLEKEKNKYSAGRKKVTNYEIESEIQRGYSYGMSMDKLVKKFKVSKGTIFKIIHAEYDI